MFATRTLSSASIFALLVTLPVLSGFRPTTAAQREVLPPPIPLRSILEVREDTLVRAGEQELPAESLAYVIQSGEVLIFNLPTSFGSQPVDTYRLRSAPSLSWLVDRSYFWRTLAKDVGQHTIVFEGLYGGHRVEDVYVIVDVR